MLNLRFNDPRFAHDIFGVCTYAPPDDDDDEDEEKGKGKGGGGGDSAAARKIAKLEDDLDKWKKMSRKVEDENKALKGDLAELKKKTDGGEQTELDKLKERLEKTETDLQKTQLDSLRLRVATRKGLSEAQAKRLQGATEEELEEDADEILEHFKPAGKKDDDDDGDSQDDRTRARGNGDRQNGRERPRESLKPGAKPNEKLEEMDPEKLADLVPRM